MVDNFDGLATIVGYPRHLSNSMEKQDVLVHRILNDVYNFSLRIHLLDESYFYKRVLDRVPSKPMIVTRVNRTF